MGGGQGRRAQRGRSLPCLGEEFHEGAVAIVGCDAAGGCLDVQFHRIQRPVERTCAERPAGDSANILLTVRLLRDDGRCMVLPIQKTRLTCSRAV
jgi:hypothetical protein